MPRIWIPPVRRIAVAVSVAAVAFLCLMPVLAGRTAVATEIRRGGEVVVAANAPVREDFYAAAGIVSIEGDVAGDVTVLAGDLTIDGDVTGSVNALAGRVEVEGSIGRSLRVAGGTTEVRGEIAGDLVVAGGSVRVSDGGSVGGDLIVTGGNVVVDGRVGGNVVGNAARVNVSGDIGGKVDIRASQVEVAADASVRGDLTYTSPGEADVPPNAAIGGEVRYTNANPFAAGGSAGTLLGPLRQLLWALVAGALIIALLPRGAAAVARTVRRVLPSFAVGLLLIWLAPLLAIVLILTLIGLPIGVILLLSWGVALYVGPIFAGLALGRLLLPRRWDDGGRGYNLLGMTLGVIIIFAVRLAPLPYLPGIIGAIVTLVGLGAVAITVLGRGRPTSPAAI